MESTTNDTSQSQPSAVLGAEPRQEHRWLQKLVGEWTFEAEAAGGPDAPSLESSGTESVRSLGDLWFVAEGRGEMPGGGPAHTLMTLGYDPERNGYVGTWIGSMMTHLWIYDGTLDESGKRLTLEAEGPSMTGDGSLAKYRDVIEFVDDDHRRLRASILGEGGEWKEFMVASYRRAK